MSDITNRDHHLFNVALQLAKESTCKFRHGVVISRGRRPLSLRVNREGNHPLTNIIRSAEANEAAEFRRSRNETFHAEARAIILANTSLRGCTLYSARICRNGLPGNSCPCDSCKQIIEIAEISTVVYFENGELRKVSL